MIAPAAAGCKRLLDGRLVAILIPRQFAARKTQELASGPNTPCGRVATCPEFDVSLGRANPQYDDAEAGEHSDPLALGLYGIE